jgi:hypothetical protein
VCPLSKSGSNNLTTILLCFRLSAGTTLLVKSVVISLYSIATYSGLVWLIIMGLGFDDWVYWHFFTITINYDSSQSVTVYNLLHSLLDHEWLFFHYIEWQITAHTLNCLERHLSDESYEESRTDVSLLWISHLILDWSLNAANAWINSLL